MTKKKTPVQNKISSEDFYKYWNYIERTAFRPAKEKDIKKWLRRFLLFFYKALEIEDNKGFPAIIKDGTGLRSKVEHPLIPCDFRISADGAKFSFEITWEGSGIQFEYDKQYTCELDYLEEYCKTISPDFNKKDLEKILEYKIEHPAIHCHIKGQEISFPHGIRLGPVTKNPFLFLYQYAFQLLLFLGEEKRREEFKRLKNVIFENREKMEMGPGVLFGT